MSTEVVNQTDAHRFELVRDGQVLGFTEYDRPDDHTIRFLHTEIDPSLGEHGLGTMLVQGALDMVRETTDLRVTATCPFTRAFLRRHPEYRDLTKR